MVDHNHNRMKPRRGREGGDKVDRELLERERDGGQDWTERGNSRMSVHFVLLANSAAHNKMLDKGGKARPLEITFKDRLSVEDPHVARKGGRVDQMEEGRGGNIHMLAEIKMAVVKRPVRKGGTSEQRGSLIQGHEGLENKGIGG